MIDEGVAAPTFELPALVDGVHRRVALEDYLGEDVLILAFFPGAFNPACADDSDLDELDLFTMQKDVTVLGIGPDTLYAYEAFAEEYGLHIPLLSDSRHTVAREYDVAFEDDVGQDLHERAVFVVDHDGDVVYAWSTRDVDALPATEEIKDAIAETGGDDTAFARFRVGHAHYVEGRRAFTSAMGAFGDSEWMIAQSDFQRAREEFTEADEHFDSAVRFVDDDLFATHYAAAEEKATLLWQAADWLAQAASHYSSGQGAEGQRLRDDAERPLEEARALAEPIDPDDWPPEAPPERTETDDGESILPADQDRPAAALEVDIGGPSAAEADGSAGKQTAEADEETDIDDAELAEIEAELSGTGTAGSDGPPAEETSVIDGPPGVAADPDREPGGGAGTGDDADGTDESISDDELAEIGAEIAASDPGGADGTEPTAGADAAENTATEEATAEDETDSEADAPGDSGEEDDGNGSA